MPRAFISDEWLRRMTWKFTQEGVLQVM